MKMSLVNMAVLTVIGCVLSSLLYPSYVQASPVSTAERQLEQAVDYLGSGQYQLAAQACEQVISSYPEHEYDARLLLAEVYYVQGQFAQALEQADLALARVTRLYPDDSQRIAEAQGELDRLRQAQQNFTARVNELNQTISAYPGTPAAAVAQLQLADTLLMYGRRQQALAEYQKVIDEYPGTAEAVRAASRLVIVYEMLGDQASAEAAYAKADSMRRENRLREEIAQLKEIIAAPPSAQQGLAAELQLGEVLWTYGETDQAAAQYQKVIDEYPATAEAVQAAMRLSSLYQTLGAPDKAKAAYLKADSMRKENRLREEIAQLKEIIAAPPSAQQGLAAELQLGEVLWTYGETDQAAAQYQKIIDEYPTTAEAVQAAMRLSSLYQTLGAPDKAKAAYLEAQRIRTGREFRAVGRPRIAEYQEVIEEQPGSAEAVDARYRIGCIYALYAEYDQAIAQLSSLIEQHPDSAPAVQAFDLLQIVFSQPDRQHQGLTLLPGLVDTYYPDNPQMLLKLCQFYRTAAKPDRLIQTADSIVASFPQSAQAPQGLLMMCDTYWQAGELDQVETTAQRIMEHYAQSDEVAGALGKLAAVYEAREGLLVAVSRLRVLAEKYPDTKVPKGVAGIINQAAAGYYREAFRLGSERKYDQAIAEFEKALALRPPGEIAAKAAYQKAICHYALGQEGAAIAAFQNVIEEHADNYLSVRAQGWIERINK